MDKREVLAGGRQHARRLTSGTRAAITRRVNRRRLRGLAGAQVQLGCGDNAFDGWVNIDLGSSADLQLDLRGGFPAPAGSVRFIYSEHFFEHLPLSASQLLLRDCAHALAPGGVFRAAMPDLEYLVARYQSDWRDQDWLRWPEYQYIDTPARMFNEAMRNWDHQYLYDEDDLGLRLKEAGFKWTRRVGRNVSDVAELRDRESRLDSTLVMEAGVAYKDLLVHIAGGDR